MQPIGKGARSDYAGDAYLYAVRVLDDALVELEAMGVAPNEQCDALGYTLINLLTEHYAKEHALLSFETLRSTLKLCLEANLASSSRSATPVSRH